jgi:Glycosyltransferase Family 4
MKVLLVTHGYPPDDADDIARAVQATARSLAALGHTIVASGTRLDDGGETRLSDREPVSRAEIPVLRLSRSDAHPEHWQKSASSSIPARFRRLCRDIEPDLVHVHHWRRLSRDLVACAAAERVPAVVTLHDSWTTCLLATRRKPPDGTDCGASFAPMPCLACAGSVAPRTPFVPLDQLFLSFASHKAELARELKLARAVLAPSSAVADRVARFLPEEAGALTIETAASPDLLVSIYERALQSGPPAAPADVDAWYTSRMRSFAEENWDRGLAAPDAGSSP